MNALLLAYDPDEVAVLTMVLQRTGFTVRKTPDFQHLVRDWPEHPADLAVIVFRRNMSVNQLGQLRSQTEAPVILIADALAEERHVELLEAGVDLVVERPYSARLLIAQVRALMRRVGNLPFFSLPTLELRGVVLDPARRTVRVKEGDVSHLTQLEFRMLYTLMMHPGQVMPAELLVEHVWGYNGQGSRDLVRGLIKRLRSKVEPDSQSPIYIQTIPGVGYVFQD